MRKHRMQIIRRAFFVEVEFAVDVIHVMHHQVHRQLTVARFDGIDQLGVFVVGAVRTSWYWITTLRR